MVFWLTGISTAASYSMISREELKSRLGNAEVSIIDVRPSIGWLLSFSKIYGAVRENPNDVESWLNKYPKEKPLILYCQSQVTSSNVARKLVSAGFQKVFVLEGGWNEWSKVGFPTEKK